MILRQLFDAESATYTYLVGDSATNTACIIDPVKNKLQQYLQLLDELGLKLELALDTHVHADHVTALAALKTATGCETRVGSQGDVACASGGLQDGQILAVGSLHIKALYTPGHTSDSYSFVLEGQPQTYLFSGDTLLIRGTGRTDFQNGDPAQLYDSLHNKLLTLPADTIVLPGHDYNGCTSSTIGEEKQYSPRLQIQNKDEFIDYMNKLDLPDPKLIDIAVPANQHCGNLDTDS